jgi:hypothetical protein
VTFIMPGPLATLEDYSGGGVTMEREAEAPG